MATCTAKRAAKLIDARFLRPLSPRERSKMEDHLGACAVCRERYRKLQLADRVAAFGEEELDRPAPIEIDRIAQDLGLFEAPRVRTPWFALPLVGTAAALALVAVLFVKPSDELIERGAGPAGMTFSAYAISSEGPRLLEDGGRVGASEHLKLRASWGESARDIDGVDVLLVGGEKLVHVRLAAPDRTSEVASVPGAISLSGFSKGRLTAYVIAAKSFDLERVRSLAESRAPPEELVEALDAAAGERIDLEVE